MPRYSFTFKGHPIGKPRQTRRDKWAKRPCVLRCRAFSDLIRAECPKHEKEPYELNWTAHIAMPKSWSKKKKSKMLGTLHQQKPDRDNIDKAILDALFSEDKSIACGTIKKLWCLEGDQRIEIEFFTK